MRVHQFLAQLLLAHGQVARVVKHVPDLLHSYKLGNEIRSRNATCASDLDLAFTLLEGTEHVLSVGVKAFVVAVHDVLDLLLV